MTKTTVGNTKRCDAFYLFREQLYTYHQLSQHMHKTQDYSSDGLLPTISEIEDEIMNYFGLPVHTNKFGDLLQFFGWEETVNDDVVESLLSKLKEKAEKHLLSPAKGATTIMNEGREQHDSAFDVLPFIDIDLSVYNIFLYESLFYAKEYDAEAIIEEMRKVDNLSCEALLLINHYTAGSGSIIELFAGHGLKYLHEYETNAENNLKKSGKKLNRSLDHARENTWDDEYPEALLINKGYISHVMFGELKQPTVTVELIVDYNEDWLHINVYMSVACFLSILKKTINYSVASAVRGMIFEQMKGNPLVSNEIDIRYSHKTHLYFSCIELKITHSELTDPDSEEMIEHHNYYETTDFLDYLLS